MRLILLLLGLMALGACRADHSPQQGRQASSGEALSRQRALTDSLVRAALANDGVRLEYRWVVGPALVQPQEGRAVFDPAMRQWLILNDTVVLDMSGVDRVAMSSGSGPRGVTLYLNATSAERLRSSTTAHLGSQLAVMLNGQLITAPVPAIRSSFSDRIPVVADVDSTVARELEARLREALGGGHQGAQTSEDSVAVRALVEAYRTAWDQHDPPALATFFTQDADMIMGSDPVALGPKAIQGWWREYFARQEPERRVAIDIHAFRFVALDVAVLNVVTTTGGRNAQGEELRSRKARGTWVVVREGGTWRISAMRGMPTEQDRIIRGASRPSGIHDELTWIRRILSDQSEGGNG